MIRDYLKKSGFFVLVARDGTKSFLFERKFLSNKKRSAMDATDAQMNYAS
ncbi:hypothetical protein [Butyrivibrio sp. LB2008]|nr:hypothetical protein [Butyrivibrio sp. LB2008]